MNELYHHGILGMKWGIRRYQNKDGSLTPRGKQHIKDARKLSEELKDESYTISKKSKTTFQRVGSKDETDTGRTYVSYKKGDNIKYIDMAGEGGIQGRYKLSLAQTSDIKVANGKAAVDAFLDVWEGSTYEELVDHMYPKEYNRKGKETPYSKQKREEKFNYLINAVVDKESLNMSYKQFSKGLMNGGKITEKYFDNLSKKGYDAVIDENDKGWVENPLIIFDRSKSLRTKKVSEITTKERDAANEWLYKHYGF